MSILIEVVWVMSQILTATIFYTDWDGTDVNKTSRRIKASFSECKQCATQKTVFCIGCGIIQVSIKRKHTQQVSKRHRCDKYFYQLLLRVRKGTSWNSEPFVVTGMYRKCMQKRVRKKNFACYYFLLTDSGIFIHV